MRKFVIFLLLLLCLTLSVSAADLESQLADLYGADQLEDGLDETQQELMGDAAPTESQSLMHAIQKLISKALLQSDSALKEAAAMSAMALGVCLLCGLCGTIAHSIEVRAVTMAGLLGISAVCATGVRGLLQLGSETVGDLSAFSQLLLPVLSAASVSSGGITAGAAIYSLTVLFSDLLFTFITRCLIPLTSLYLALSLADCALGNRTLNRIRGLISFTVKNGLKAVLYVFTAFLTITQVISGTTDAMTAKAAKLAFSGAVPVVGGILSDASDTVLVSAALLKNSVGVYGMLAILSICILPFLKLSVYYLAMKLTAAVSGTVAQESLTAFLDAVAETMGFLLAMVGASALLLLVSSVCSLKAVGY